MKQCPFCDENIKERAIVCKHCGIDLYKKFTMTANQKRLLYSAIFKFLDLIAILFIIFHLYYLLFQTS